MAVNWNFNPEEAVQEEFAPIPEGDHRARIYDAQQKVSKNGKDMIELVFDVSGYGSRLWYYIVFLPENSKMTNQKLGQLFDSFGLNPACINNPMSMVGATGAVHVKHEEYNGDTQAKVNYLVSKKKQETLPPWKEPARSAITHGEGTPAPAQPQMGAPVPGANGFNYAPEGFKAPWES